MCRQVPSFAPTTISPRGTRSVSAISVRIVFRRSSVSSAYLKNNLPDAVSETRPSHHTRHPSRLDVDHRDEFLHRSGALVEGCFFFRGEFDLDDLLDPLGSEFYRNSDE